MQRECKGIRRIKQVARSTEDTAHSFCFTKRRSMASSKKGPRHCHVHKRMRFTLSPVSVPVLGLVMDSFGYAHEQGAHKDLAFLHGSEC